MFALFLGLVSASILPSISLVIGSLSATGRSVQRIEALYSELSEAINILLSAFGWVAAVFLLLMLHSLLPIVNMSLGFGQWQVNFDHSLARMAQALIAMFSALSVVRSLEIPKILRGVLRIKREIAIHEARKQLDENVPSEMTIKNMFPKKEDFGKTVHIEKAV